MIEQNLEKAVATQPIARSMHPKENEVIHELLRRINWQETYNFRRLLCIRKGWTNDDLKMFTNAMRCEHSIK